jgi:hypothetical protein
MIKPEDQVYAAMKLLSEANQKLYCLALDLRSAPAPMPKKFVSGKQVHEHYGATDSEEQPPGEAEPADLVPALLAAAAFRAYVAEIRKRPGREWALLTTQERLTITRVYEAGNKAAAREVEHWKGAVESNAEKETRALAEKDRRIAELEAKLEKEIGWREKERNEIRDRLRTLTPLEPELNHVVMDSWWQASNGDIRTICIDVLAGDDPMLDYAASQLARDGWPLTEEGERLRAAFEAEEADRAAATTSELRPADESKIPNPYNWCERCRRCCDANENICTACGKNTRSLAEEPTDEELSAMYDGTVSSLREIWELGEEAGGAND